MNKTIGNNTYQYEVSWDPKLKKQVWKYIGKIDTNASMSDHELSIGKAFTNDERDAIKKMLKWIEARPKGQSGHPFRKVASLFIERLGESDYEGTK